jgi:1-aminocyclopropane-1-carboxylate deaminase/D-cysteine desulfhydrase-like pyridoxal-dependent ACC family enzyme
MMALRAPRAEGRVPILEPLPLGRYPTPVRRCSPGGARGELWVKDDGDSAALYGGNKVRKLEYVLAAARARGARRIVTFGAGGSHHVLATTLYGRSVGLATAAVLWPQPWTAHAEDTLRAALAAGLEPLAVRSRAAALPGVACILGRGDYLVPPGGSSRIGARGYLAAAHELATQIRAGEAPEPDAIVVALGSGGTAAGILAGVVAEGLRSRVIAVDVAIGSAAATALVLYLAYGLGGRLGDLGRRLGVERGYLGAGYGHPTEVGARATVEARAAGLTLDPTYTAKTFAAALDQVRRSPGVVLYWNTLSGRPLEPLLAGAPALPAGLASLFPRPRA